MQPRRITLVADELLGYAGNGLGTATTFLAVALARVGHRVEVPLRRPDPYAAPRSRMDATLRERGRPHPAGSPGETSVQPPYFARMRGVELALRADPPEVVVVQDLGAPGYSALRLRHLGLAFESTSFVVYCHGTRQWVTDMARKVRVLPGALGISALERAAIELADVAVSPSAYMVEWMQRQGWRLPETTLVIPLLTRSGATGEPPPERAGVDGDRRVERLAYFGRLEERKGVRPFVAGLNSLDPQLLDGVELEFIGRRTNPRYIETGHRRSAPLRERPAVASARFLRDGSSTSARRWRGSAGRGRSPSCRRSRTTRPSLSTNACGRGIPFVQSGRNEQADRAGRPGAHALRDDPEGAAAAALKR